jgi:hypothetical protein
MSDYTCKHGEKWPWVETAPSAIAMRAAIDAYEQVKNQETHG